MSLKRSLVLPLLFAAACTPKPQGVVEVDEHKADLKSLGQRAEQVRLLRPETSQAEAAAGLIEGWLADSVLRSRGKALTRDDLAKERTRLEKDEKIARLYREVARIYGDNAEAFLELGLLPDLSLRRAVELYQKEGSASEELERLAGALLKQAQNAPAEFAAMTTAAGAEINILTIDDAGVVRAEDGREVAVFSPTAEVNRDSAKKVLDVAKASQPGAVLGLVLRTANGHLLVKRIADTGGKLTLETALLRHAAFGDWLKDEAAKLGEQGKLRVCIHDEDLRLQYERTARVNLLRCPK